MSNIFKLNNKNTQNNSVPSVFNLVSFFYCYLCWIQTNKWWLGLRKYSFTQYLCFSNWEMYSPLGRRNLLCYMFSSLLPQYTVAKRWIFTTALQKDKLNPVCLYIYICINVYILYCIFNIDEYCKSLRLFLLAVAISKYSFLISNFKKLHNLNRTRLKLILKSLSTVSCLSYRKILKPSYHPGTGHKNFALEVKKNIH